MNLDYLAAKYSQELVENATKAKVGGTDLENAVTKMLGILQSNGVYASFLFAQSRQGKEIALAKAIESAAGLLKATHLLSGTPEENRQIKLETISEQLCHDIHKNHLAMTVMERFLIYARYHAKGLS